MTPGLPVTSIPRSKLKCHETGCLEFFEVIRRFESKFIQTHQASMMICKLTSLKSWIKTGSFLEKIITSTNEVFKVFESNMAIDIW